MIFVNLQPYHISFNLFGQADKFHGWSGTRRNIDYGELRGYRFDDSPKMYGPQFECIEIADITMHGWMSCPAAALCGKKNELSSDLHAYFFSYQTLKKKGHLSIPFDDWFFSIPGIRSHEADGLAAITFGIDKDSGHHYYFVYIEKGVLHAHRLTETCVIVKKKVITLKQLHELRAQRARDDLERALAFKEELAKCTYDLADKIQGSTLLNFL